MAFALDFFPNFESSWPDRPGLLEGVACRRATARGGGRDVARILQGVRSLQRKRAAARVRGHVNRRAPGRSGRWRCARAATRSARVGLAARTPRRASWTPHSRALRRSARPASSHASASLVARVASARRVRARQAPKRATASCIGGVLLPRLRLLTCNVQPPPIALRLRSEVSS